MRFLIQSFKSSIANILRNKLVNFLSLGIIAFTLFVLGIFNFISHNLGQYINKISESVEAIVYLRDGISEIETRNLIARIEENLLVKEVRFHSKKEAEIKFSGEFPELKYILSEFPTSPFPASIEIQFNRNADIHTQIPVFVSDVKKMVRVESVELNAEWAKKIAMVRKFISGIGYFLSIILIFVSIFIIYNVIKLNIFYRKDEIVIFRLVGATNGYIKIPFILEGCQLGFLGGILASLLLVLTVKIFPVYAGPLFNIFYQMIDFKSIPWRIPLELSAAGGLIGIFSSILAIKKYFSSPD